MAPKLKIVVTPRSFGKSDPAPIELLASQGYDVVYNPYGRILTKDEMKELLADADGVIVGVDPLDRDVLAQAPRLRIISKYGVGTDNIDLKYAEERGIRVATAAGSNTEAVADFAFALMMAVARRVNVIDRACREGIWKAETAIDIYGKTLGLLGLGAIGKAVARRAAGFGMKVLAYDLFRDEAVAAAHDIAYRDTVEEIVREADFISLHLPLDDKTAGIIGREQFAMMKPTAVLVNTARGGLIDEAALLEALRANRIWGAGIDVFEKEPPDNPELLALGNLIAGSHCAASTQGAVRNMGLFATQNLIKHLEVSVS